jgi:hypothetical protein
LINRFIFCTYNIEVDDKAAFLAGFSLNTDPNA